MCPPASSIERDEEPRQRPVCAPCCIAGRQCDTVLVFLAELCKPCGQFSVCKSRIHVLAANRRDHVGSVSAQKNPAFAEAFCHIALHAKTAFPKLANAVDINAGAT